MNLRRLHDIIMFYCNSAKPNEGVSIGVHILSYIHIVTVVYTQHTFMIGLHTS